jgi:hypothetical protein
MEYSKSTVLPSRHIVEIEYGNIKMRFHNPKALGFSVSIRKAAKGETV